MKKKALILFTKRSEKRGMADASHLRELLSFSEDFEYTTAYFDDLYYEFFNGSGSIVDTVSGIDLKEFDVTYLRRWGDASDQALAVSGYLRKFGKVFVDTEAYRETSISKLNQYSKMWEYDMPIPGTRYAANKVLVDKAQDFTYPLIAKSVDGTRGAANHLVNNADELVQILSDAGHEHEDDTFLIQDFIPNDCDYRVLVMGDKIHLVIKRSSSSEGHLNNVSQGGIAEKIDIEFLTPEIQAECIKLSEIFRRNIAGVDIVFDKNTNEHFYFEVNRAPQIDNSSYEQEKAYALNEYLKSLTD